MIPFAWLHFSHLAMIELNEWLADRMPNNRSTIFVCVHNFKAELSLEAANIVCVPYVWMALVEKPKIFISLITNTYLKLIATSDITSARLLTPGWHLGDSIW